MTPPPGAPHRRELARRALTGTAAALWLLLPSPAGAQTRTPPLSGARVAAEFGAGLLGTPLGFLAGGLATGWAAEHLGVDDPRASRVALTGAWVGAALATAAGPWAVGVPGRTTGSYPAALGGAVAGGAASYALVRLNDRTGDDPRPPCHVRCVLAAVAVFALPSIGATVGFNLSRRYQR